ncbi:hypothetical protein [Prescottella agglutinans]|uniref:Uncharacterized protein n=1 Tax=Prescottella agglutinans TaxID=1644129 RepID=A0ABT6ML71_9NOCA|nr:hypothetical protein [Prescottella agglutinans]MDH6285076.1 hypothetical protein [Prescottella agglutinans]
MRLASRAALVAATAIPLAMVAPAVASATDASEVTYSFTVDGSRVKNTITNNTGTTLTCGTALAPAPGGVLPPVADVITAGQTLYDHGEVQPGVTTQAVTEIPDGAYVVLATCGRDGSDPAMWVSDYPGIEDYLKPFQMPAFTVQQASTVVTVPNTAPPAAGSVDLGTMFGS